MQRVLLNLYRVFMSLRHLLPVVLLTLVSLSLKAQCPPTVIATPASTNICSGDSVLMECSPSTGTTWQWYKNGDIIPGATNSSCFAYDAGNYSVIAGSCSLPSVPVIITIKPLPYVSISSDAEIICSGQQVTLSVTTGPNVTWVWIEPVSLFGKTTNPVSQTLTKTTEFQIVGVNMNTNCANTSKVTVEVNPPLNSGTVQSDVQICPGDTPPLIISAPATGGSGTYSYQWQVSTTSSSSGFSNIPGAITLNYQPGPTSQTTWYRMAITSPPCPDEYSNAVVVKVNPNPTVTSSPTQVICSGNSVNYNPSSNVAGATFTWIASVTSGSVSGLTASGSGNINDILSLPAGSPTSGTVTYVITPSGPSPTNCAGVPKNLAVTVNPIPSVTNAALSQNICAGTITSAVILTSNVASTIYSWTASGSAGLSGYQTAGSGNIPAMQIFSTLLGVGTIQYTIIPHGPAPSNCDGPSVVYTINVEPAPIITNSPMLQTICTGDATNAVNLTSNIATTTFTWTATAVPSGITGFQASGTNTIPSQTIINYSNVQGVITYHIIPGNSPGECIGIADDYKIFVNPKPIASVIQTAVNICSGTTTNIALSSNVTGAIFNWTASSSGPITGYSNGSGNVIAQTLSNSSIAAYDITYVITPTFKGCAGNPITVTVTVNPAQVLSVIPVNPTVCSGDNAVIALNANVPGITFTWTASAVGNVTGYSNGYGPTISQTLVNNDNVTRTVVYAVNMSLNNCSTGPVTFNVTVYPKPALTSSPLMATRCSGAAFNLALTSDVAGTTYTWTANGTPGTSGFAGGNGNTISQTITNSSTSTKTVVYTITPSANGCNSSPVDYTLTVNPVSNVNLSLNTQSVCSGSPTTPVTFTSATAGTTFTWTAVPSGAGITGYAASGSAIIPSQAINNTLNVPGTVTYNVIPSYNGCNGSSISHLITINPRPIVTNASMSQAICSGATSSNVNLLSNISGTTFTWIATASSSSIIGYQTNGNNNIPSQTIFNSGTTPGTVTYHIIPTSNYSPICPGAPADYTITVNPKPAINSSLVSAVCSGDAFKYTITSNIAGSTFTWSRMAVSGISNSPGSGSTATINETLVNTTNNDIDVTYLLTPFGQAPTLCAGTPVNLIVKVRALPQVNAGTDFTIPYGTYTTLNGTSTGGTGLLTYTWTPNSYISSGANTLTPQTEKLNLSRTYSLTVNDAAGCNSNDPITVFVVGTPVAAAPIAIPSNICLGQSTTITANASGGSGTYTYSWTSVPAGFTSTSVSVSVSPAVNTVYTVKVDDGFNSVSSPVSVTINPLPSKFGLTGGGSYCLGGSGSVVGLAGSQSGVTYQLYNNLTPVGSPVSGSGAAISFGNQTSAGIYTVIATRVSTGCTIDMGSSVAVSINAIPIANAGIDQVIPYGTSTTLAGSFSGGFGTVNYSWTPITFIALDEKFASPKTTNLYSNTTYTLNIIDANGCTGSDQVQISLSGNALNVVAAALPADICADESTAQLLASVSGGSGTYTFSWTCSPTGNPAWASTLQNPIVSPDVTTTYTVTANDGFNSAIASVSVLVNPLPLQYSVVGGGSYCYAGTGVSIGLSGSESNTNYQLYRGGVADGPAITGNGSPISFGNRTAAFNYTVIATNNITGCTNTMNGSATIIILPPPSAYLVTGGGSYPSGGPGKEVGLIHGDPGVSYQLFCDNVTVSSPVGGTGNAINFGLQTHPGTYTIEGTDIVSGCSLLMNGSVNITILPYPLTFNVYGGGGLCDGQPGLFVHLNGSEISINYQLLRNGFPYGAITAGTNAPLTWGPFTSAGLFEVRAINATIGITQMMEDSAVIIINPLPTLYTINPTSTQCPGTIIRLNGSQSGLMYYLLNNGIPVYTMAGNSVAGFLEFGPQTVSGTYTVKAVNPVTGCWVMMNGSTFITVAPDIYDVIPAGILCPGQTISLSGSQTGVNYQLRWNGTFDLGTPLAGTGSPIAIGSGGLPGIYSAIATDATTNCVSYMNDTSTLYANPTAFTIAPDRSACEGDIIGLNGSEVGVDYVLLLDNAIHIDTISGTGAPVSFGPQLTAGNYTIIAINQTSYCVFPMNGTTVINESPIKYAILPAGIQCIGTTIYLSNSQPDITYQLMLNGIFNMGSPVSGTGSAISFGSQSLSGTYTIRAVNDLTGCNTFMADSIVIDALPIVFTITPAGSHCAGASIGLNGSEINVNYILVLNGSVNLDTIPGTGSAIDFGAQQTGGNYTVAAYNTTSYCSNLMNGNSVIETAPIVYALMPSGVACIGSVLGLENSGTGISYQLRLNESINVGVPVAGTGSAISFGIQNLAGTYRVVATNTHGCFSSMSTSVVINPLPVAFNVIPSGSQCQGTSLGLDGTEVNVTYILVRNGNVMTDTIPGTGSTITFGPQFTSGAYSVIAFSKSTYCQSIMNGSSVISNIAPTIYSMTPAGIICAGAVIGIDNSEIGASYQLRMNGTINMGAPVAGTGSAINFGVQTLPGVYTAIATNLKGCSSVMSGKVVVNSNPVAYNIIPTADHCPGISIGINGSETGVNYILLLDNAINIDTLTGNGSALSFGGQTTSGTYTVLAYNLTTLCQTTMNGSNIIIPAPIAFNMTPAGIKCVGSIIGLNDSEMGVYYQLRRNGITNVGTSIAGTGSSISFGIINIPGTYTVIATSKLNGCGNIMNGNVVLKPLPLIYTLTPEGKQCAGISIKLNGSQIGTDYVLVQDNTFIIDTIPGTGNEIDFGPQLVTGTYTVEAINGTACQTSMNGSTQIIALPTAFNITPAGISCAGSNIGIDASETGITYQLYFNGGIDVGSPVAGTGAAIHFGIQNLPGTYSVKATNSIGCITAMSSNVEANPLPIAFNLLPSGTQCQGTSLGLDGSEINANYVLVHNGNVMVDTIAGTGSRISFGPQLTSGKYSVIAFFTASHCQSTMIGTTTILSQPAPATYSMTPAGISCGNTILGLDDSETGISYQLCLNAYVNVGTPVKGTGSAISFGMQKLEGVYTVIATNSNGCRSNALNNVTIGQFPTANFSYNLENCDSIVNFKDMTSGTKIERWIWNFGDGKNKIIETPESPDFKHYYSYPGTYEATLITVSETGCSDTITKTILRKPCIAAAFKVSDPVICQKRSMKFTETSVCEAPIASWTWYFGDNTSVKYTTPQPFIEHIYAIAGNYTAKMVVATQMVGGMVTDTASSQVAVKPAAKAAYRWQDVCVGTSTLFENQTQNNNTTIKSYLWNFGDPGSLTDTTSAKQAEYKYNMHGEYNVKLVVTNTLGCTDTIINKVHIFESPAADFSWNNSCEARPVYFVDKSVATSSDIVMWNWQFSSEGKVLDKSTEQNCTFSFMHAGTYNADMKVTDQNGCSTTINKQVKISPNPVAAFSIIENYEDKQGQISLSNGTINGTNNYWDFGNGLTSYGSEPIVTYNEEGHYRIQLLTWNDQNCTDTISIPYDLMYKGLYVPNAFSPDDINPEVAVFRPKGINLKSYYIEIYDRWGNLLWKSDKLDDNSSPAESWDGTINGKPLQQDVYVWKITAQYKDGERWDGHNVGNNENVPQMRSGTVTLLR